MARRFSTTLSIPVTVARAPFPSEMPLHRFLERNTEKLLGLKVVASDRAGGGRVSKIDILAVNHSGTPHIIECIHGLVKCSAFGQIERYREALLANWDSFERLATKYVKPQVFPRKPVLVLVGYGYERLPTLKHDGIVGLVYRYHDIPDDQNEFDRFTRSRVSLHYARPADLGVRPPTFKKKLLIEELMKRLYPADRRRLFWELDEWLTGHTSVRPTYSGKNYVNYSKGYYVKNTERRWRCARVTMGPDCILWAIQDRRKKGITEVNLASRKDASQIKRELRQVLK